MKYFFVVVLLLLSFRASAQWEHVAWEGGSSYALVQDGNVLYCATGVGGVYRSTDGGLSWQDFNQGIAADHFQLQSEDLVVTTNYCILTTFSRDFNASLLRRPKSGGAWQKIAVPVSDSCDVTGLIHIGTDSVFLLLEFFDSDTTFKKNGVYFSSDAGTTWTKRSNGLPSSLSDMALAIAGNTVCLSTRRLDVLNDQYIIGGVFTSTDCGQNWVRQTNGIGPNKYFWLLASNGSTFIGERYVFDGSFYSFEGISRSTDGGKTWINSTEGLSHNSDYALAFATVGSTIVMSMSDSNFISTDHGASWKPFLPNYNFLITYDLCKTSAGSFLGTNAGVVVTNDDLPKATDADLSQAGMFAFTYVLNYVEGNRVYVGNAYNDDDGDFLLRSTDAGNEWGGQSLPTDFMMSSAPWVASDEGIFTGGRNTANSKAVILKAPTADDQWQIFSELPRNGTVRSVDVKGSSIIAGVEGEDGKAYCFFTSDMGANWQQKQVGSAAANAFIITKFLGLNLFVVDDFGFWFLSRDGGSSWLANLSGMPTAFNLVSAASSQSNVVAVGYRVDVTKSIYIPEIYISSDFGYTWSLSKTGIPDSLRLEAVMNDPHIPGIFYASSSPGGIFSLSAPTHSSVFSTTDNGLTWIKFSDDLPEAARLLVGSHSIFAQGLHGLYRATKLKSSVGDDPKGHHQLALPVIASYPNPATSAITLSLTLAQPADIHLALYDELGREIRTLVQEHYPQGKSDLTFSIADLATGQYFARVTTRAGTASTSIIKQR